MVKTTFLKTVHFFIFSCYMLSFSSTATAFVWLQDGTINQYSTDGKKQGKWVFYGADRPELGYPAEGKIEEGNYKDDRREGVWTKYYPDGKTPKQRGEYQNNRPNGSYVKFHPNGKIKETGTFEANEYKDSLKRFHENGKLMYEANYNGNGKEEGKVNYYYANGQVEFEYTAVNGINTGKALRYYENGDVKEIIEFSPTGAVLTRTEKPMVNQKAQVHTTPSTQESAPKVSNPIVKNRRFQPNGYNKVYNTQDEIWQDGDFKDGRLYNGKVYVYDSDGILLKVKVFKQGVYHSDGQL